MVIHYVYFNMYKNTENNYMKLYENEQPTNKSSTSMEELKLTKEKRLERSPKNPTTQLSWLPMGLSAQALIYGICITLFSLVLLNLG